MWSNPGALGALRIPGRGLSRRETSEYQTRQRRLASAFSCKWEKNGDTNWKMLHLQQRIPSGHWNSVGPQEHARTLLEMRTSESPTRSLRFRLSLPPGHCTPPKGSRGCSRARADPEARRSGNEKGVALICGRGNSQPPIQLIGRTLQKMPGAAPNTQEFPPGCRRAGSTRQVPARQRSRTSGLPAP